MTAELTRSYLKSFEDSRPLTSNKKPDQVKTDKKLVPTPEEVSASFRSEMPLIEDYMRRVAPQKGLPASLVDKVIR